MVLNFPAPRNSFPLLLPELSASKVLSVKLTTWIKGELICIGFYSSKKMLVKLANGREEDGWGGLGRW